ncbi:glycosyltransferase [Pararobbsia alpina]|uniref:Glycosyltransferase 2-like domain-containing protein n=1 Tax=Pararobbsia alpina TaxID=621374 RepID=A0A6S7BVT8_9BURK|nr:glycosyltransferase [Pararobbsia alpina]CAB3800687.1 hypothetical protein LMG28138_04897 [Pararobbsia alpina]
MTRYRVQWNAAAETQEDTACEASPSGAGPAVEPACSVNPDLAISVVVPTYRRPELLMRCLGCLLLQTFDASRYEIIVCDDGPDDDTRKAVHELARLHAEAGPLIRYLAITATQGPAAARNAGWRIASAPLVAFTDDDTEPAAQWLSEGIAAFDGSAGAVVGHIDVPLPPRPTDYELDASGLARAEFATANVFVERAALIRTRGFDERFTSAWREDSDLQFALLAAGIPIGRAERAVVRHPVRPARWGVSLSQQRKSQFDALLFKKYPTQFCSHISAHAPHFYYAVLLAAMSALIAAFAGHFTLAACATLIWAALTLTFCFRRLAGTSRTVIHVLEMLWTSMWIPFLSIYWRCYGALKFRVWFP